MADFTRKKEVHSNGFLSYTHTHTWASSSIRGPQPLRQTPSSLVSDVVASSRADKTWCLACRMLKLQVVRLRMEWTYVVNLKELRSTSASVSNQCSNPLFFACIYSTVGLIGIFVVYILVWAFLLNVSTGFYTVAFV